MMAKHTVEFAYYLEAWKYCRDNKVNLDKITKKNFRTWQVIF